MRTRRLRSHSPTRLSRLLFFTIHLSDASQGFLTSLTPCSCFVRRNGFMWHIVCVNETQTMTELLPFLLRGCMQACFIAGAAVHYFCTSFKSCTETRACGDKESQKMTLSSGCLRFCISCCTKKERKPKQLGFLF